jgi:hypothetical protein
LPKIGGGRLLKHFAKSLFDDPTLATTTTTEQPDSARRGSVMELNSARSIDKSKINDSTTSKN